MIWPLSIFSLFVRYLVVPNPIPTHSFFASFRLVGSFFPGGSLFFLAPIVIFGEGIRPSFLRRCEGVVWENNMIGKEGWGRTSDWGTVNLCGGVRTSCASSPVRKWDPHKPSLPQCRTKSKTAQMQSVARESSRMGMSACLSRLSFLTFPYMGFQPR